ncbi:MULTISPECIES: nucleotide exchange factor GrpE [Staphylococcus]|jgi:molecular chaperone GrpE|uniref:Protein GrpE n=1 Tax=Staphylococcus equorum TaxID=246432 RepID=A0AAP7IED0_9STAP|nr:MULTISPECIES: nucleotide exchange factor GrpE [Staphylococcus]ANK37161.1 heat shock protein GrpE [Staphylococcus sp. AntiMn-1]ANR68253.1 molecular chaperone GrpE [Staphylococcus equorum]ERH35353.1 heat shock protein GrpE [Staphylococcus equorum UMC-CNS-924]MCE5006317.1 nucleotide exchange factor GrpE [Staphylococcus equorum]MCE5047489.1 nucleotide exchange factor GrpE [Staphylococcus equorum]
MTEKNESVFDQEANEDVTDNEQNTSAVNTDETTDASQDNLQEDDSQETTEDVDPKDEEIQQLKQDVQENEEKYLRLYAEFENYKRRIQKENQTMKAYKAQDVLNDILPTIDNIERALQIEGENEQFQSLKKGVEMIHESLINALKENGLELIETEGHQFDPNVHQAVVQDDNPDFESGEITQELQKGYKLKERVLRPSMVKVNQ